MGLFNEIYIKLNHTLFIAFRNVFFNVIVFSFIIVDILMLLVVFDPALIVHIVNSGKINV